MRGFFDGHGTQRGACPDRTVPEDGQSGQISVAGDDGQSGPISGVSVRTARLAVAAVLIALAATTLLLGAVPVAASNDVPVEGTVDIDVDAPDNEFDAGEEATLQLQLSNEGEVTTGGTHPQEVRDIATEARSAEVNITDTGDAPVEVRTGTQSVGTIDSGDTVAETFDIYVEDDADPGEYEIEVTVDYRNVTVTDYGEGVGDELEVEESTEAESTTVDVTVTVADEARFEIDGVDHEIHVDEDGDLSVAVTNTGSLDVTDVVVTAQATEQAIFFGAGGASSDRSVGEWEAGETKTLTYRAGATEDALTEPYPVELSVEYTDPDGETFTRTERTSVTPLARQDYAVMGVNHSLVVGEDAIVEFRLRNEGPLNVTDATVSLTTNDPALTFEDAEGGSSTTETYVGDWSAGETVTVSKRVGASNDAAIRTYAVDATVSARDQDDEELTDRTRTFGVQPRPRQRYSIDTVNHTVSVDDDGVLTLELTNHGPLNVSDASVTVSSNDAAIVFGSGGSGEAVQVQDVAFEAADGGQPTSEAYVGDWPANETRTVKYLTGATEDALERNYTLDVTIDARDENDHALASRERSFGFRPDAEQSFRLDGDDVDLRVGEDQTITGQITNTGDQTVRNVVVLYDSDLQNVFPREEQYAVGTLGPGESKQFSFRIGISEEAEAGPRVLEFSTRYRNPDGDARIDDSQDLFVQVNDRRDAFAVRAADATFEAGESGLVAVELRNTRDEPVENVRAKVFPDTPLSSDDDEAYVARLEPNESTTVQFELGVAGGAIPKAYPMSLDIRYEDERGRTQLSGTYRVPVEVEESSGGGLPLRLLGIAGLAVVGGAVFFRSKLLGVVARIAGRGGG